MTVKLPTTIVFIGLTTAVEAGFVLKAFYGESAALTTALFPRPKCVKSFFCLGHSNSGKGLRLSKEIKH